MVTYLIGIIILLIILYLNLVVSNKLLYPPVLFSLIWTIVLALHWINSSPHFGIDVYPLKANTIFFLLVMNLIFSLACFLSYTKALGIWKSASDDQTLQTYHPEYHMDRLFFEILNVLSLFFALLFLRKAFLLTSSFDLGGPFIKELRVILNYHDGSFGWIKYMVVIVNTNFFIRLLLFNKVKQRVGGLIFAFLLAMGVAILNTGRTFLFFILFFSIAYWLFNWRIQFKKLLLAGFVMIFFFSLVGFLTEKGADMEADLPSNISSMYQSFTEYLLGPVTAFQEELQVHAPLQFGRNTFRSIFALLYDMQLIKSPPADLVQQFSHIPFRTNVYTAFSPYHKDFGYLGVSVFMALLGGLYGVLYYFSVMNRLVYQYFFLILIHPLLMTFFQDMYFSLLSHWIQYFIVSLLVFGLFVLKTKR